MSNVRKLPTRVLGLGESAGVASVSCPRRGAREAQGESASAPWCPVLGLCEPCAFLSQWVELPDKTQGAELNLNFKQEIVFQAKRVAKI